MKLSNKLLILLGIICFAIPLTFVIANGSGGVNADEYFASIKQESSSFAVANVYLKGNKLEQYNTIVIQGENGRSIDLHLIKDKDFGFKCNDDLNELEVSKQNEAISLNFKERTFEVLQLYLYAPYFENVTLSNLNLNKLKTVQDSLSLNMVNSNWRFNITGNETLKFLDLTFNNSSIGDAIDFKPLEKLKLTLNNSAVKMYKDGVSGIDLKLKDSNFELKESENDKKRGLVKDIHIESNGNSNLTFPKDVNIEKISANLSDSTSTNLPVVVLKKIIK